MPKQKAVLEVELVGFEPAPIQDARIVGGSFICLSTIFNFFKVFLRLLLK